jgi:ribosomal-protein-alanine N-acetyltransferase
MVMNTTEILTSRLRLRPFKSNDLDELHRVIFSDADVMKFLPGGVPRPQERTRTTLDYFMTHITEKGFGAFAVLDRETGAFLGQCGLNTLSDDAVEIFYAIGKPFWGRGYTTEAAAAVLDNGFNTTGLERIIALAVPENRASRRVMEKIGMTFQRITEEYYGAPLALYVARADTRQKNQP